MAAKENTLIRYELYDSKSFITSHGSIARQYNVTLLSFDSTFVASKNQLIHVLET